MIATTLTERQIEDVFEQFHEQLVEPGLRPLGRQQTLQGTRLKADLVFEDRARRKVVLELKRHSVSREDVGQLLEYAGLISNSRVILVAPHIASAIKTAFEHYGIEYIEFSMTEIAKLHRLLGPARSASPRPVKHTITALARDAVPEPLAARTLQDGNIAFKVTYNDRGWANVCSPDAFQFNVFEKKTFWCCKQSEWPDNCQSRFYRGRALSADRYPCYDSVALATLSFSPGWNHRTDAPHVCKEAKVGKVTLLTSRAPGEREAERFIFAILLIARLRVAGADHSAPGTEFYEGDQSASIVLERSSYVRFWDHYRNPRASSVTAWKAGLFRYADDATVREILAAVAKKLSLSHDQRRKAEALLERY
jgi:Endonuclease NucS